MKKALSTILQYVIFLGLGIWIVYRLITELSPEERTQLVSALQSVNLWYLIPIFFVGFLSHFFRAMRWRLLLETIDLRPTLINTTFAVLIGYVANLALPRAGEVAKCTVLAKYEKMPAHKMVGTIVAERAFDMFSLLIIAILAFLLQAHVISSYAADIVHSFSAKLKSHEHVILIALCVLAAVIVITIIVYRRHRNNKIGTFMKEISHGVLSIFNMKKRWQFLGYTVLIWLMYLMQLYIGFIALPAISHLTLLAALVVLVYGSVGMIVTPGGIGLYTLLVTQILMAYPNATNTANVDHVSAEAFGWIAWSIQTSIIIVLGLAALLLIHPYNKKRNAQAGVDTK